MTRACDRKGALKDFKKTMRKHSRPEVIVTDRLRSYGAALKEIGLADRQETGRWVNNRAENSHLPFQRRERALLEADATFAEIRIRPSLDLPPVQSGNKPQLTTQFQAQPCAALAQWRGLGAV